MNKRLLPVITLILLILSGCVNGGISGAKPPKVYIEIEGETHETTLGTYCWGNTCVDTVGPFEILEGKEPIKIKPGETIYVVMDYEPKPNEFHVLQMNDSVETEVTVQDNHFTAPTEQGIYYYSYGAWWMDEKEENVSNGDAFYAFMLEVEPE